MNIFFADDCIVRIILTLTEAAWSYKTSPSPSPQREGKGRRERRERRRGKERNGGAARSANLGGCKGRAANGGEGKSGRRESGGKSGRFNRPEKEERSKARGQGEGGRGQDEGNRTKDEGQREQSKKKGIADTIGTKNIKFYFIGRKTPENLHMCKKKCNFARFLWAKDELAYEFNN